MPSRLFYDNQLVEAADAGVTGALTAWGELPTRGLPLLVYGLEGLQCHEHDSPSFFNPPEALKVAQLIEALLAKGAVDGAQISTGDIGVVAPFRKQVHELTLTLTLTLSRCRSCARCCASAASPRSTWAR